MENDNYKEIILEQLDFKRVYADYGYSLNGKNQICCFHDDHNPSLSISLKTGSFNCFGCGKKGSFIDWYMLHHNVDYKEAIKQIAEKYNIELPKSKNSKRQNTKKDEETNALVEKYHNDLTPELWSYLKNERGLTEEIIKEYKFGCGEFYGTKMLCFPIFNGNGKALYLRLRRLPEDNKEPRYLNYPSGIESELFNSKVLSSHDEVFLTSGELDALVLISRGLPAISSTAGEGTLKDKWLEELKKLKKITLIPDTDEPGQKASRENLKKLLELNKPEVYAINLKFNNPEHKDTTDFIVKEKRTIEDLLALRQRVTEVEEKRIYDVRKPEQELDYNSWKSVIKTHFPEFCFAFEVAISVPSQLLLNDIRNPFGLFFIGVPGEGKTIKLNVLDCVPEITYSTDKFTAASFVSNSTAANEDKLKKIDMLPRIQHKHLIIKDASPLFSKEPKELMDILGTLTRIFDGEGFQTDTGAHGGRGYKGDYTFMMTGASTPIKQNVWDVMGSLGARLFFYNLTSLPKNKSQLVKQLKGSSYKQKEKICREATEKFLRTLFNKYPNGINWDTNSDSEECLGVIADCALLLSRLRGVIKLAKDSESNNFEFTDPLIEDPSRINQLLYNLCRAHAVACGRTHLEQDDLKVVLAVALDSAPERRSRIIKRLFEKDGKLQTSEIEVLIGKSQDTALREMRKLHHLGVVCFASLSRTDCTQAEITLNSEFEWFLSEDYKEIIGLSLPPKQSKLNFEGNSHTNTTGFMRTSDTPSQKSEGVSKLAISQDKKYSE